LNWEGYKISQTNVNIFVNGDQIQNVGYDAYWDWMIKYISKIEINPKLTELAMNLIAEFKDAGKPLTLLHSDFHGGNIAFLSESVLLFDSGDWPYLFGHRFHDLSRFISYYPEGTIFENETIQESIKPFVEELQDLIFSTEFVKFCFLQSLLVYNNSFVPRIKESSEYLYNKLR
jgi:hypothetical protein